MKKFIKNYPKFFVYFNDDIKKIREITENCGAGYRSMVLGPSGKVRPCLMLDENYFSFGNLTETSYKDLIREASKSTHFFYKLKNPNIADCNGCNLFPFCSGCFVRPIHASERLIENKNFRPCLRNEKINFFSMMDVLDYPCKKVN